MVPLKKSNPARYLDRIVSHPILSKLHVLSIFLGSGASIQVSYGDTLGAEESIFRREWEPLDLQTRVLAEVQTDWLQECADYDPKRETILFDENVEDEIDFSDTQEDANRKIAIKEAFITRIPQALLNTSQAQSGTVYQ